jgi:hypothetical protein
MHLSVVRLQKRMPQMKVQYSKNTIILLTIAFLFSCCGSLTASTQFNSLHLKADYYFGSTVQVKLARAIERSDEKSIDKLITEGADVNAIGKYDIRPLFWALAKRKIESFEILLKNGADPNFYMMDTDDQPHQFKPSLMEYLVELDVSEYLKLALQYVGNPNFVVESFYPSGKLSSSSTIIYSAIMGNRFENVRMLVRAGADLDHGNFSGETPSQVAAAIANFDMVFFFLEQGADPTIKDNFGYDLSAQIRSSGDGGINPKSEQYGWYLKVVKELKRRALIEEDWNPTQPAFRKEVEELKRRGLLYNKSLNADASEAGAG